MASTRGSNVQSLKRSLLLFSKRTLLSTTFKLHSKFNGSIKEGISWENSNTFLLMESKCRSLMLFLSSSSKVLKMACEI